MTITNVKDKDKPVARPNRKQYTRSNAATAMSITLVEPAETLVCMYANERQKNNVDINNHIAEHHFKTKHQID